MIRAKEEASLFRAVNSDDCTKKVDLLSGILLGELLEGIWKHRHVVGQVLLTKWNPDRLTGSAGKCANDAEAKHNQSSQMHLV